MLDNYIPFTGESENITQQEKSEQHKFLQLVMETDCMKYVHNYLVESGKLKDSDPKTFKDVLWQSWFYNYSRDARNDTSGFEHVFVGEIKEIDHPEEGGPDKEVSDYLIAFYNYFY